MPKVLTNVSNPIRENQNKIRKVPFYKFKSVSNPIRENQNAFSLLCLELLAWVSNPIRENQNHLFWFLYHMLLGVSNPIRENQNASTTSAFCAVDGFKPYKGKSKCVEDFDPHFEAKGFQTL